ncbi:PA3496 family putative envelope integrity protein [Legionella sp. CNM-4043-24]|uniref:PA3496 family putative envelope integrity protein n=1 Tax=Legionella sp. CNM-4043-24 TaxID=3421646 RepID=UPI00403AE772
MSSQHAGNTESDSINTGDELDSTTEASPGTKLERRRRIEDLFEQKRLREEEELGEFDLV